MRLQEPFGICQNYPVQVNSWHLAHDLDLVQKLGVRWLRTEFDWRKIEPRRGKEKKFRWYDALVRMCHLRKIQLVPVLVYSPKWVAPRFNFPPEDPDAFSEFVSSVVGRYHHYVKHWEIWNEANSYYFWIGDAKQYSTILTSASAAAKQLDPDCKILMCGLADPASPDKSFLLDVLRHVDESAVDIINLHAYPGTWNQQRIEEWPLLLQRQKDKLSSLGINKPFWITETGLTSDENNSESRRGGTTQASYLIRAFASLLGSGVAKKVFWYRLKDEKYANKDGEQFGLLTQSSVAGNSRIGQRAHSKLAKTLPLQVGSLASRFFIDRPKPAFQSYVDLIRLLGQDFENVSAKFENGFAAASFITASHSVNISWRDNADSFPRITFSELATDRELLPSSKMLADRLQRTAPTIISKANENNSQRE